MKDEGNTELSLMEVQSTVIIVEWKIESADVAGSASPRRDSERVRRGIYGEFVTSAWMPPLLLGKKKTSNGHRSGRNSTMNATATSRLPERKSGTMPTRSIVLLIKRAGIAARGAKSSLPTAGSALAVGKRSEPSSSLTMSTTTVTSIDGRKAPAVMARTVVGNCSSSYGMQDSRRIIKFSVPTATPASRSMGASALTTSALSHLESVTTSPQGRRTQASPKRAPPVTQGDEIVCSALKDAAAREGGFRLATGSEHQDKNSLGVSAGMIWGLKKTMFNSVDFGALTISTYAVAH